METILKPEQIFPYLFKGLKFAIPHDNHRILDSVSYESWSVVYDLNEAIDAGIESALKYKTLYAYQKEPFISVEEGDWFLGQMVTSEGWDMDDVFLEEVIPIMRPLTDLYREIECNGEIFTPTKWFRDNHDQFGITQEDMGTLIRMVLYVFNNIESAPAYFVNKLIEWNFWIGDQSLFDSGEIIDVNKFGK